MIRFPSCAAIAAVLVLAGCTPTLNWRELTPDDAGIAVLFPCRPDRHARTLQLAGASTQMQMLVCSAGDSTYALSFADVGDPARVAPALLALRDAALRNIDAGQPALVPLAVRGMTPHAEAVRLSADGRLPDGRTMREHAAFFAKGMRVYQASVIGARPSDEAVDTFFSGLKLL
jgi:hypothetical protein